MDLRKIIIIMGSIIVSMCIAHFGNYYVNEASIIRFLTIVPTLNGILLASVLTSTAIIFGITGIDEMTKIQDLENQQKRRSIKIC
jgi:hypothetical protein